MNGITADVQGWGGLVDPQNAGVFDPTAPWESKGQSPGVNTNPDWNGIGCGTTPISTCDLIVPPGEDILLIAFDQPVIAQEVCHIAPGNLPYGLTEHIMLVAENTDATALRLSRPQLLKNTTPWPEE